MNILFVISIYVVVGIIVLTSYFLWGIKVHLYLLLKIHEAMHDAKAKVERDAKYPLMKQKSAWKTMLTTYLLFATIVIFVIIIFCIIYIPILNWFIYKYADAKKSWKEFISH